MTAVENKVGIVQPSAGRRAAGVRAAGSDSSARNIRVLSSGELSQHHKPLQRRPRNGYCRHRRLRTGIRHHRWRARSLSRIDDRIYGGVRRVAHRTGDEPVARRHCGGRARRVRRSHERAHRRLRRSQFLRRHPRNPVGRARRNPADHRGPAHRHARHPRRPGATNQVGPGLAARHRHDCPGRRRPRDLETDGLRAPRTSRRRQRRGRPARWHPGQPNQNPGLHDRRSARRASPA